MFYIFRAQEVIPRSNCLVVYIHDLLFQRYVHCGIDDYFMILEEVSESYEGQILQIQKYSKSYE